MLEVGTGSGYQAAVLAQLARNVYSIEIVEPLGREAAARLSALGYANVEVTVGDGYRGRPDRAPFDAIVVTAGAPRVPQPLVDQLKPGGRLVIPLDRSLGQELVLLVKRAGWIARAHGRAAGALRAAHRPGHRRVALKGDARRGERTVCVPRNVALHRWSR